MSRAVIDESSLYDIGDAIRLKKSTSDTYTPSEMAGAIRSIPTGITQMTVQYVNGTFESGSDHITVTAPSVTGYEFLCWLSAFSSGATVALNFYSPAAEQTTLWRPGSDTSSSRNVTAYAIYISYEV